MEEEANETILSISSLEEKNEGRDPHIQVLENCRNFNSSPLMNREYLPAMQKNLKMYLNKHRNNRTSLLAKTKRENKTPETNLKCINGKGPGSIVGMGMDTRLQGRMVRKAKNAGSKGDKALMKCK